MRTKEAKDKADKAQSADFGFSPMGQGMAEMMSRCCAGRGGSPDCPGMMKKMMEAMTGQHCAPDEDADESERKKK
jgi:hypothetical protein